MGIRFTRNKKAQLPPPPPVVPKKITPKKTLFIKQAIVPNIIIDTIKSDNYNAISIFQIFADPETWNSFFHKLSQCTQITDIQCNRCEIHATLIELRLMDNVQYLDLGDNPIQDDALIMIAPKFRNLLKLRLSYCRLTHVSADCISRNMHRLQDFSISYNRIGNYGVDMIARRMPQLRFLKVEGNDVTDRGTLSMFKRLRNLQILGIGSIKREAVTFSYTMRARKLLFYPSCNILL